MTKTTIVSFLSAIAFTFVAADTGCSAADYCGTGQEPCGNGCMPSGNVCCGDVGNCPAGDTCGPGATCLSPYTNSCLASGQETCDNFDGVSDCAPLGATCCHNHTYCPVGNVCNSTLTGCVQ